MFGSKKSEDGVKPMSCYPSDQLKDIKNALTKKVPHIITDVKWEDVTKIFIDRVQIYKNAQGQMEMYIKDSPTKDYLKAWNLGLGRFIKKDLKKETNLDKYKFVYFPKEEGYKGLVAFIRFIDESDLDEDTTFENLKKMKCISIDYTENKTTKYVSVMKVFVKSESYSDEFMLNQYSKIMNVDDEYWEDEFEEFYSTYSNSAYSDDSEEEMVEDQLMPVKNMKGVKEEEYLNQDNLF